MLILTGILGVRSNQMRRNAGFVVDSGAWFNGRTSVSKTADEGSIPSAPAINLVRVACRMFEKKQRELVRQ